MTTLSTANETAVNDQVTFAPSHGHANSFSFSSCEQLFHSHPHAHRAPSSSSPPYPSSPLRHFSVHSSALSLSLPL